MGSLFGERSPVATLSETFYADVFLAPGAVLPMPIEQEERALFVVEGAVTIDADNGNCTMPASCWCSNPGLRLR